MREVTSATVKSMGVQSACAKSRFCHLLGDKSFNFSECLISARVTFVIFELCNMSIHYLCRKKYKYFFK